VARGLAEFRAEGAGPRATRVDVLGRFLSWFVSPPSPYGLISTTQDAPLIGLPGTAVSQTIRLDNIGVTTDTVDLLLDPGAWPVDFELPDGRHVNASTKLTLNGCSGGPITATVSIPAGQPRDALSINALRFMSQGDLAATAVATVTAKTPAPILLVDDERWYNHQDQYTRTLDSLELSYDLIDTLGGAYTPKPAILQRYPLVVWTTGYDWYSPLTAEDRTRRAPPGWRRAPFEQSGHLDVADQRGLRANVSVWPYYALRHRY
jgi:hypothetical protein